MFHDIIDHQSLSLKRVVGLGELASGSRDAVDDILEGLLRLGGKVRNLVGGRVGLLVAPVDLESVELKDLIEAEDILGLVRGETAELRNEAEEFLHVVTVVVLVL